MSGNSIAEVMIDMTEAIQSALKKLYGKAKKDQKGDYITYSYYRKKLEAMNLSGKDYQTAIIKLCDILRV